MLAPYDVHCMAQKGIFCSTINTCWHSTAATTEGIRQLKIELLLLLPYSPNLVPMKYHMFGALKEAYHGWRSASDDYVKDTVHPWLQSWPKTLFVNGIRSLVNCYTICVEKKVWLCWEMIHSAFVKVINKFALLFDSTSYYTDNNAD